MTHEELLWLALQAQTHRRIVEIGSFKGRSTRALGDNTEGVVFAIDDFQGPRDVALPVSLRGYVLEDFLYSNYDLIQAGRVVPVIADHAEATVALPDMVFLDGSHLYEDVKRDILRWSEQLAPGGLLCGHDFTNIASVRAAVEETGSYQVAPGTSIWYR